MFESLIKDLAKFWVFGTKKTLKIILTKKYKKDNFKILFINSVFFYSIVPKN